MAKQLFNQQELAVYGQNENAKRYQDLKNRADDAAKTYDWNLFDPSTYNNFGNWLANGVSGGGWTHKGRMEKAGFNDELDAYGKSGQLGNYALGKVSDNLSNSINARTNQLEAGKGLFSGIPVIGSILSAPAQAVSAGKDFAESGTDKWKSGKRDWLSDVGAIGETALDIATLGAGGGAAAGAKTLGQKMGTGALIGAGYGLTGGLNEMGAKNFDLGNLALGTGIGAGVGGGLAGLGALWNKYSQPGPSKSTELMKYQGGATNNPNLQEYMKTLGITGDGMTAESLNSARKQATKNLAKTVGYESAEGQAQRTAINNAYQALLDSLNGKGENVAANVVYQPPKQNFAQKLKNFGSNIPNMGKDLKNTKAGTKVSNLLKTKKGKIGAGVGGGLLLSQLMKGNNSNNDLSDEELAELYNYVYGGQ